MISMQEVVEALTDCELSNLIYVDMATKEINVDKIPKLIRSINLGVLDLHKRFLLKEGTVLIRTHRERHRYYLRPEFQVGNGRPKPGVEQYIEAGDDKLNARSILKIERVIDECGMDLAMNNLSEFYSVSTPSINIIDIPDHVLKQEHTGNLTVKFRMAPKTEVIFEDNLEDWMYLKVDIPYTHLQALIWYVASRSHSSKGFMENTVSEFNNYGNRYEMECQNLDALNLRVDQVGTNDRLSRGGWV